MLTKNYAPERLVQARNDYKCKLSDLVPVLSPAIIVTV